MTNLLIHIGLHRTGSTWIQRSMLPDDNIPIDDIWPDREDLARRVIIPSEFDFAQDELRAQLEHDAAAVTANGRFPAISHERLSGNPNSGAFDRSQTAHRLHELAPGAKILIILREQQSALESIWCQAVRIGLYASAEDYLRPHHPGDFRCPHFVPEYLLYDRIVSTYVDLFGKDRVLALDFERLRSDPREYTNLICDFVGVPRVDSVPTRIRYARPHPFEASILRRGNLLFRRTTMNPAPPLESDRLFNAWRRFSAGCARLAPRWMLKSRERRLYKTARIYLDKMDERIRQSNNRLANELGVQLMSPQWRI